MASLPMQQPLVLDNGSSPGKLRSRVAMKPILKKLHSHSESDRTSSFDTDRDYEDQPSPLSFPPLEYYGSLSDHVPAPAGTMNTNSATSPTTAVDSARQTRDVSFSLSSNSTSEYSSHTNRFKHARIRSPSGTSHASVATSTSGRNGSFVHPFQQTPRAATPPLSYANSIASQDTAIQLLPRAYNSVIAENDDAFVLYSEPPYSDEPSSTAPLYSSFGGSQRSSSQSDPTQISRQPPAIRSNSGPVPRLNDSTAIHRSVSDAQASSLPQPRESALSSTAPLNTSVLSGTPNSATSTLSPLRNSLDMSGFRLRSRSEADPATRQEQVREARRKFEAKERAKDEKYATKQLRKRERADNRDSCRHDRKQHARLRKESSATASVSSNGRSSSSNGASSRKSADPSVMQEKVDFASTDYNSAPMGMTPKSAEDVQFESSKRRRTAKRKTTGVWTAFMLWLRTGIFRMGRR